MTITDYEKRVLFATPEKALAFLRGSATKLEIRAALFAAGYTQRDQAEGWSLLAKASGVVPELASTTDDAAARAAIAELDAWDEPGFRRIGAALGRLHPEQYDFVFAGLESVRGAGAVLSVSTLLDRLDALEGSDERNGTRTGDHQTLATLTARGITPEVRQHLRGLIVTAQTVAPPVLPADTTVAERDAALVELRAWLSDWSETARAVITRKDYLVMLGLSTRRTRNVRDADDIEDADTDTDGSVVQAAS